MNEQTKPKQTDLQDLVKPKNGKDEAHEKSIVLIKAVFDEYQKRGIGICSKLFKNEGKFLNALNAMASADEYYFTFPKDRDQKSIVKQSLAAYYGTLLENKLKDEQEQKEKQGAESVKKSKELDCLRKEAEDLRSENTSLRAQVELLRVHDDEAAQEEEPHRHGLKVFGNRFSNFLGPSKGTPRAGGKSGKSNPRMTIAH